MVISASTILFLIVEDNNFHLHGNFMIHTFLLNSLCKITEVECKMKSTDKFTDME